ncbi:MAG: hypothetical protein HW404_331 [Anaerolineales bacterium]|jgi:hypothetical protein|nr:hypothetical protein [Anaerolineales bacterium]
MAVDSQAVAFRPGTPTAVRVFAGKTTSELVEIETNSAPFTFSAG